MTHADAATNGSQPEAEERTRSNSHVSGPNLWNEKRRALDALQNGDPVRALLILSNEVRPKEQSAWTLAHLADAYARVGDHDAACGLFEQALKLEPTYAWGWAHWGDLLRIKARDTLADPNAPQAFLDALTQAIERFDDALAIERDYGWVYAHRAATGTLYRLYCLQNPSTPPSGFEGAYCAEHGVNDAEADLQTAVEKDFATANRQCPNDPWVLQFEAIWRTQKDDYEKADQLAGRALLCGAPSLPLAEGMALTALYTAAKLKALREGLAEDDEKCGSLRLSHQKWKARALARANSLMALDPTNPAGHLVRAMVYKNESDAISRKAYTHALDSLQVLRHQLDQYIEQVSVDPETQQALPTAGTGPSLAAKRLAKPSQPGQMAASVPTFGSHLRHRAMLEAGFILSRGTAKPDGNSRSPLPPQR